MRNVDYTAGFNRFSGLQPLKFFLRGVVLLICSQLTVYMKRPTLCLHFMLLPLHRPSPSLGVPPKANKMPPKLKSYVARSFGSAKNEEERELIHKHLDATLNKVFAEKRQWEVDWDSFPLPL